MSPSYIGLDDLKADLGITDDARDSRLTNLAAAATRAVNVLTGRGQNPGFWLSDASARIYDPTGGIESRQDGELLLVDDIGDTTSVVVEGGSVGSTLWSTLQVAGLELRPLNAAAKGEPVTGLLAPYGWVRGVGSRVRVTARWGWPQLPADVTEATLRLAARLFARSDTPEGVRGNEWGIVRVARADPDVMNLLADYTRPGMG